MKRQNNFWKDKTIFDTHCHLAMDDFEKDLDNVVLRAEENSVLMLSVGTSPLDWQKTIDIKDKYEIPIALGFSPHDAKLMNSESIALLRELLKSACAVGETGLDYHYFISSQNEQLTAFESHIQIAEEINLPLIVHSRDSFEDTLTCLKGVKVPVVIHCFTYGAEEAEKFVKEGFFISFSGISTFKNAENIREAARIVPEDRILVETDAPYLSPLPYRGKRCEPLFVKETASFLARFFKKDEEQFFRQTLENGLNFFKL
ncbi:MAG: TatD family hydrolase [Acidobacteria bacterium]|nr:TatD family hydrolase [Acidobacteriota bacterium]